MSVADQLCEASLQLARRLEGLTFSDPVRYVYHPVLYAWRPHEAYIRQYAGSGRVLLLGMNPGPFGMAQTGVPFGDVHASRDWLNVARPVDVPAKTHPRRPVLGFDSTRGEGSGRRLWGWAATMGPPSVFFSRFFVWNYCPLLFLDEGARNVIPEKLVKAELRALEDACTWGLQQAVQALNPERVIGVGAYAAARAAHALPHLQVGQILHPSPANPQANRDWMGTVQRQLEEQGVRLPG